MTPPLAVIIPTFKRTDSLERLLDLLANQEGLTLEVIVVDQNVPAYFSGSLRKKLEQVNWITQPTPNASLARNNGFSHSKAPYVLFLDDDLMPEAGFCAMAIDIFKKFSDIKSFVPLVYSHLGKELSLESMRNKFIQNHPSGSGISAITETISAAVFFERSYYEKSGGFDELLFEFAKTSEDQEFFLRMRKNNMHLWFVPYLAIFHDEKVEGGCELRTAGYWNTRSKCLRAIALRHRIHKQVPGKLSLTDLVKLARSSFLNKNGLTSGLNNFASEVRVLRKSIEESRRFYLENRETYTAGRVDFIGSHLMKKEAVHHN